MKASRGRRLRRSAAFGAKISAALSVIIGCAGGAVVAQDALQNGSTRVSKKDVQDASWFGGLVIAVVGAVVGFGHYHGSR